MPLPTHLYVMAKPGLDARGRLVALRERLGLCPHYGANRFHCTLLRLGEWADWPEARLADLVAALDGFACDPFPVLFDRVVRGPRGGAMLRAAPGQRRPGECHRALRDHVLRAGLGFTVQASFALHLTLAYRGPHRPDAVMAGPVDPVGWPVEELLLVHSLDGYGAHEVLGRWPLEPRQLPLPFAA